MWSANVFMFLNFSVWSSDGVPPATALPSGRAFLYKNHVYHVIGSKNTGRTWASTKWAIYRKDPKSRISLPSKWRDIFWHFAFSTSHLPVITAPEPYLNFSIWGAKTQVPLCFTKRTYESKATSRRLLRGETNSTFPEFSGKTGTTSKFFFTEFLSTPTS